MKKLLVASMLAFGLVLNPACAANSPLGKITSIVTKPPSPVQLTQAAADTIDAGNKLGEIALQFSAKAHTLKKAGVLPVESDNAVQTAAIAFANGKDVAVEQINKAQNALQMTAAVAPLIGEASKITSALKGVSGISSLPGVAGLISAQLPDLLKQAGDLITKLGGK